MKYALYFLFWIAVFYVVIKFGISAIEDEERDKTPDKKEESNK